MEQTAFPTKGNLILAQNTLILSKQGYELLDKKRNVLMQEMIALRVQAKEIQERTSDVFRQAYAALQEAHIAMGINHVKAISLGVPVDNTVRIRSRSVMGVDIPSAVYENTTKDALLYDLDGTGISLEEVCSKFNEAKDVIVALAAVENAVQRLAVHIRKTQRRANALKNVTIPKYTARVKQMQETLEERDRDEFTRLKVIKRKR